ncbi:SPW repeat protein [Nocardia abscessus]|uniref:SPW repeat protein n=1 Tax=Nocardia abscessus TaxID=120957 RepID=UPI001893394D|nr:SPW repeat protein [Nocardia abscessus]MBF6339038.1 SPW repeat protein [Nocardia abscessus]
MSSETMMSRHPDIVELREKYERASEAPDAQAVTGLLFLTGLYLAISPWVVGFNDLSTLTVNNLIVGIALAMLAFGFASVYGRTHGIVWAAPLIGLWTILAPWIVSGEVDTTSTIWNNVITGGIAVLLGLGAMVLGMSRTGRVTGQAPSAGETRTHRSSGLPPETSAR